MKIMNLLQKAFLCFAVLFLLGACETELDINDDYEQVPVVFGLLNINETQHTIRINRTYLGGNALEGAQEPDSSKYTNITPVVEEVLNGNVSNTYTLTEVTIADKDTNGVFYTSPNTAYTFTATLRNDALYRLKFVASGKQVFAETILAKSIGFQTTYINRPNLNIAASDPTLDPGSTPYLNVNERFDYDSESITRVESIASLVFNEKRTDGSTVNRSISLKTTTISFIQDNAAEERFRINTQQFLANVGNVLSKEDNSLVSERQIVGLEVNLIGGSEDLDIYIQVGEAVGGISQEKPDFTNVFYGDGNGLGLFASTVNARVLKELSQNSEKLIVLAPETGAYKFCSTSPLLASDPRFACD